MVKKTACGVTGVHQQWGQQSLSQLTRRKLTPLSIIQANLGLAFLIHVLKRSPVPFASLYRQVPPNLQTAHNITNISQPRH